jgi:hypothetical protein
MVGYRIFLDGNNKSTLVSKQGLTVDSTVRPDLNFIFSEISKLDSINDSTPKKDEASAVFMSKSGRLVEKRQDDSALVFDTSRNSEDESVDFSNKKAILKIFRDYMTSIGFDYYAGITDPNDVFRSTMYKRSNQYCYVDNITRDTTSTGCLESKESYIEDESARLEPFYAAIYKYLDESSPALFSFKPESIKKVAGYEALNRSGWTDMEEEKGYYYGILVTRANFHKSNNVWTLSPNMFADQGVCSEFNTPALKAIYAEYICTSGDSTEKMTVTEYWKQ